MRAWIPRGPRCLFEIPSGPAAGEFLRLQVMWFACLFVKGLLVMSSWECFFRVIFFLFSGECGRWLMLAKWLMSMLACCLCEIIVLCWVIAVDAYRVILQIYVRYQMYRS